VEGIIGESGRMQEVLSLTIVLPPLRERREDIAPLIDHFLKKFAGANRKEIAGLTREGREMLFRYDYPGNVRELENIIERAVVLTRDGVIGPDDLPLTLHDAGEEAPKPGSLPAAVEEIERQMIHDALVPAAGIQTRAAETLGISERVLCYKLKKYGLSGEAG